LNKTQKKRVIVQEKYYSKKITLLILVIKIDKKKEKWYFKFNMLLGKFYVAINRSLCRILGQREAVDYIRARAYKLKFRGF